MLCDRHVNYLYEDNEFYGSYHKFWIIEGTELVILYKNRQKVKKFCILKSFRQQDTEWLQGNDQTIWGKKKLFFFFPYLWMDTMLILLQNGSGGLI